MCSLEKLQLPRAARCQPGGQKDAIHDVRNAAGHPATADTVRHFTDFKQSPAPIDTRLQTIGVPIHARHVRRRYWAGQAARAVVQHLREDGIISEALGCLLKQALQACAAIAIDSDHGRLQVEKGFEDFGEQFAEGFAHDAPPGQ